MANNTYVSKSMMKSMMGRDTIKKKILENFTLEDVLDKYIDKLKAHELRELLKSFDEIENDSTNS